MPDIQDDLLRSTAQLKIKGFGPVFIDRAKVIKRGTPLFSGVFLLNRFSYNKLFNLKAKPLALC